MSAHKGASSFVPELGFPAPLEKKLPAVPIHIRYLSILSQGCKALVRHWWAWDFLAAGLSILAAIALIALLTKNNGQLQQPFWLGIIPVSLNVLVVAISTVVRTSLLVTVAGAFNQSSWNWFFIFIKRGQNSVNKADQRY